MSTQSTVAIPSSVVNSGNGILWAAPSQATSTGIGTELVSLVVSYSITSNVITFVTPPQTFAAGQSVTIANMYTGTYLNGIALTILSAGLSSTGFTANYTHADVALTYDSGTITPTTNYTNASNIPYISLTAGQNALYISGQNGAPGFASNGPHTVGPITFLASSIYAQTNAVGGVNGYPFGSPTASSSSLPFSAPTLPAGSTVVGIYPYATGTVTSSGGSAALSFDTTWTGGSGSLLLNGNHNILSSIGTDLSIIPSLVFTDGGLSTQETDTPYTYSNAVSDYGVLVVYTTTGTPIPATQLQTLAATNLGLAIPSNAIVRGVSVSLGAGTTAGTGTASLTAQLTIGGSPVGNVKTLSTLSGWATPYLFGGSGDPWGNSLLGAAVNGSSGLGVNISGTLPSGDQINLNSLVVTVYYSNPAVVAHITIGNTRPPTVGFN